MKIVTLGKKVKEEDKEHKKSCNGCGCKFTYTQTDVKHDRDGYYVHCPQCNAFIGV